MRLIDRYICREIFSPALLGLGVFTFVFFVPQLVRLMDLVVRHAANWSSIALLFLTTFPGVLTFTLPMAVLVGVLIGLGRMSADSELIALHAVGIGFRRLLLPVGVLALGAALATLGMTVWLGPASVHIFRGLQDRLRSSQASFQVQPRVFDERFPRLVLYVQDVEAAATHWHGIFLAEARQENSSRLTLAEDAIVIADREQGKLQFHLRNGSTHEYSRRDPNRYAVTTFGESDFPLEITDISAQRAPEPTNQERLMTWLLAEHGPKWREARVELHRRLAFPAACLVFALLALPLGARPRRGGRAAGFLIMLVLICGYYLLFIVGAGLARQGRVSPGLGIWAANALTALLGVLLLPSMDHLHREGWLQRFHELLASWQKHPAGTPDASSPAARPAAGPAGGLDEFNGPLERRQPLQRANDNGGLGFLHLIDLYVLRNFMFYFTLFLVGFILLFEVFTFFELLDDIARHRTPFLVVLNYFRYLAAYLGYQLAPLAALVGVLVTLAVMTKNNEIVAFKAAGVSLYRLSLPLLIAGLVLAGALLALDDTYLPYANRRQDALRNQIKGRPTQTFFQPRGRWIFGENSKIYNYELFDPDKQLFGGLNVYVLDRVTFQLRRRVFATRAHWEPAQKTWILESGWVRDLHGSRVTRYVPFQVYSLDELTEPPSYFNREVRQYYQMDWFELRQYIQELQQAGFDVARLTVQWHKKLAFPLMAPVIMLLAIPFAFLVGARGAIGGLALGVAIGIVYWATSALSEAMGAVGQLPPLLAGWAPDVIFSFVGLYFFLKMQT